ncbi:SusC/RagA family TonB-linked outer membrane protein [Sphingobacterium bovistauri]|uniref:SusC/RagA family TonB-linked outer membrane protein n=1 Tax=Sphingobacterium bovistauri TaxID=2781959 RepID=A0ABS7Z315_9SPHI|nr:SusC/RagA family TonB-linked outer membrane protein [Sphingobacterium bovistauri]MCA5003836.1 SusC/RagA family TonB-linked outer membrane protein [Sphingobacterium bovistauri]
MNTIAQTTETVIVGKITDKESKEPIPGATVVLKDNENRTIAGTTSDIEGNYSLRTKLKGLRLYVTSTGYEASGNITIGDRRTINVQIQSTSQQMEEVVINASKPVDDGTGMGLSKARNTASIATINMSEMAEMQSASIDQALQGRLPGVDIATVSGDPGAGMQIKIRGTTSLNGASDPLIVVDGMPYEITIPDDFDFATSDDNAYGQLLNIAPSDIQDISVLKDAAATAIWGSRGANGVLVINTKRGTVSKPTLGYTFKGSISKQPSPIPLLNGDQYTTLLLEEFYNAGRVFSISENAQQFQYDPYNTYTYHNFSNNSDWVDAITQLGYFQDHNIQIRGGGEKARYMGSLGYFNNAGTTIGTSSDRLSARINLDYIVSERITFQSDLSYSHVNTNQNYFRALRDIAYRKMPNQAVWEYDEYGNPTGNLFTPVSTAQGTYAGTYNPLSMADNALSNQLGDVLTSRFAVNYKIIPQVLTLVSNLSFNINNNKTKTFLPQIATGRPFTENSVNVANDSDYDRFAMSTKTSLLVNPQLGLDHLFTGNVTLFTEQDRYTIQGLSSTNTGSSYLQDPSIPSRTLTGYAQSSLTETRSIGLLGQMNYAFKNRYIFMASFRMDGNSRFGAANRFGYFPAISGAWRMGQEKFIQNLGFIDDIKFRASWGRSGKAPGGAYSYINIYNTYDYAYLGQNGVYSSNIELANLRWETITQSNVGIDIELLKNRLILGGDVYKRRTSDLFMNNIQIANYNGFNSLAMNVGVMDNDGWEASLYYAPVRNNKWNVNLNFNIANNRNIIREISPLYPRENARASLKNKSFFTYLQEDNPFGSFYGFRYKGVYKDKNETIALDREGNQIISPDGETIYMRFNYPTVDYVFQAGDAMYEDINFDGVIDHKDIVYLGNSNPKFTGGFGINVSYNKQWSLSTFFNYRQGSDIINGTKMNTTDMLNYNNQSTAVLRRWREEGDITDMPRALFGTGYNSLGSSRYVEDASFLRLRTLTLKYDFNKKFLDRVKMGQLSTYVTVENLLTFTNYTGQDPDVAIRYKDAFSVLMDNSMTPPLKTITLGINARF